MPRVEVPPPDVHDELEEKRKRRLRLQAIYDKAEGVVTTVVQLRTVTFREAEQALTGRGVEESKSASDIVSNTRAASPAPVVVYAGTTPTKKSDPDPSANPKDAVEKPSDISNAAAEDSDLVDFASLLECARSLRLEVRVRCLGSDNTGSNRLLDILDDFTQRMEGWLKDAC